MSPKMKIVSLSDTVIKVNYEAETDKDTVVNMTNHSYFNMNGHSSGSVDGHSLWMNCEFFTPNTRDCMPTGEIISVKGTPFDFTTERTLGECFASDYEQIAMFKGFDHNMVLCGTGFRKVASVKGDISGIAMEVYTDRDGMQLYTTNGTDENRMCKDGTFYKKHGAVCFETQAFPNNLKHSHFPSSILRKGEKYDAVTEYRFV